MRFPVRAAMAPPAFLGALLLCLTAPAPGYAQRVDWEAINPAFQGARFVNNDEACADCHEKGKHKFDGGAHTLAFRTANTAVQGTCESCHGPRGKHVNDEKPIPVWTAEAPASPAQQSGICMQCHASSARMSFKAGAHLAADVSCTACHNASPTQAGTSRAANGRGVASARANATDLCFSCHSSVRGEMSRPSHHPVREGRMDCASCHNVHGSNPALLKSVTVTETCTSCHTEKRGPFLWEHAPSRENCANCHSAHGTASRKLLNKKEAFLCMQCHSYGGHINLPRYNRTSNPYGDGCVNCHTAVHGSNHPSGAKLTR